MPDKSCVKLGAIDYIQDKTDWGNNNKFTWVDGKLVKELRINWKDQILTIFRFVRGVHWASASEGLYFDIETEMKPITMNGQTYVTNG
jgi:hypothetical protein